MDLAEARAAACITKDDEVELVEKALAGQVIKLSDNYQEKADALFELATIQIVTRAPRKGAHIWK